MESIFKQNDLQLVKDWNKTKVSRFASGKGNDEQYKKHLKGLEEISKEECLELMKQGDLYWFQQDDSLSPKQQVDLYNKFCQKAILATTPLQMFSVSRNFFSNFFIESGGMFIWKQEEVETLNGDKLYYFLKSLKLKNEQ